MQHWKFKASQLKNENVPRAKIIEKVLENIPPIKETRVDAIGEAPWVGSRSNTQFLVENYKLSLCTL